MTTRGSIFLVMLPVLLMPGGWPSGGDGTSGPIPEPLEALWQLLSAPGARAQAPPEASQRPPVGSRTPEGVAEVECRELHVCRAFGWCSETPDGGCAALEDDNCLMSEACAGSGSCRASRGVCLPPATTSSDCHVPRGADLLSPCADLGLCDALDGTCFFVTDEDSECQTPGLLGPDASPCSRFGACVSRGGTCVAERDEHCRASDGCRELGRCTAIRGWCLATLPADCAASVGCVERGECRLVRQLCGAALDDCLELRPCLDHDLDCRVDGGSTFGPCHWPAEVFTF